MKWFGRLLTSAAAVLLTTSGGVQASPQELSSADAAWAETTKANTLEAYAAFVMQYPESKHAQVAYTTLSGGRTVSMNAGPAPGGARDLASEPGFEPRRLMIV